MKAVFKFFSRLVKYIRLDYRLRKAVRMADDLYAKNKGQYFVLPDKHGNLVVISYKEYRMMRSKGMASKAGKEDIYRECFYCTRWKNAMRLPMIAIKAKRKMYFEYFMR